MIFLAKAEWETQVATWLAFPHNKKNWNGKQAEKVKAFYYKLILTITKFQKACILVPKDFQLPELIQKKLAKNKFPAHFIKMQTDDIWIRDYGPFFNTKNNKTTLVKTKFNAWGEKFPPYNNDSKVPERIAKLLKTDCKEIPYIFEGGALEFNDDGLALTTLPCLTGKNRNSVPESKKLLNALKKELGLKDFLVLPNGLIGDHTDGHIDNIARFVAKDHIVVAYTKNKKDANYKGLHKNYTLIKAWLKRFYKKAKIDILELPEQKQKGTEILPASYLNFIFVNGALIYPKYDKILDKQVQAFFEKIFPERKIIGIDAKVVIEEGGSLHCLTKHQSA